MIVLCPKLTILTHGSREVIIFLCPKLSRSEVKKKYQESLEYQAREIINKMDANIVLREDLLGLGSYRQISRVLNKLIEASVLAKISQGVYAKAYKSEYVDYPLLKGGFENLSREALDRLGVDWDTSDAEKAYNQGITQQVPVNNEILLKSRCRRQISYVGRELKYEGNVYAR